MNLRKSFPRSMRWKMEGYVHLARMIDKCRAVLAGTEEEYIYPCPMDFRLMEFAGITDNSQSRSKLIQPMKVWPSGSAKSLNLIRQQNSKIGIGGC